jgi:transposase-like protein
MWLQVLDRAGQTSVTEACRTFGVSRTTYHRWAGRAQRYGLAAPLPKGRRPPVMPTATPPDQVEAVLAEAVARPTIGAQRLVDHLAERVAALAQLTAATTGIVTPRPRMGHLGSATSPPGLATRDAAGFVDHVAERLVGIGVEPAWPRPYRQSGPSRVQRLQQPPRRVGPRGQGGRQLQVVQQLDAGLAEPVAHAHRDAAGGQDRVHLALPAAADRDQPGPMAYQLAQVADLGWSDPGVRRPTHVQPIRQISGVAEVVLHPPGGECLHAQRVGQVQVDPDQLSPSSAALTGPPSRWGCEHLEYCSETHTGARPRSLIASDRIAAYSAAGHQGSCSGSRRQGYARAPSGKESG